MDRVSNLVTELVKLKVDVLVVPDSLARPGGNITGLMTLNRALSGKRLQLLIEIVPHLSRVAVLRDADSQKFGHAF